VAGMVDQGRETDGLIQNLDPLVQQEGSGQVRQGPWEQLSLEDALHEGEIRHGSAFGDSGWVRLRENAPGAA
jgi:hypothetical protein